jgi:hypothetical protein
MERKGSSVRVRHRACRRFGVFPRWTRCSCEACGSRRGPEVADRPSLTARNPGHRSLAGRYDHRASWVGKGTFTRVGLEGRCAASPYEDTAEERCDGGSEEQGGRRFRAAFARRGACGGRIHKGATPSIVRDQIPDVACACRRWTTASEPPRPRSIRPSRPPAPMTASAQSMPPSACTGSGTFTIITFGAV